MIVDKNTKICVGEKVVGKVYQGNEEIYSSFPYILLQYITSDHNQYIDTGVPCNTLGRIVTKFKVNKINTYN